MAASRGAAGQLTSSKEDGMTKYEIEQYGERYFASDDYNEQKKVNAEQMAIRDAFMKRFTPEFVAQMDIDDYVEGKDATYKNSFCYILEFRLERMGMIRGSYALPKFAIIYSEDKGDYVFYPNSKFGKDKDEIFANVRQEIVNLIDAGARDDYAALESNKLSPMFKGKIYYVYYPEKALPVYSEPHVDFFIRALGIPCDIDNTGAFEKRRLIVDWKNSSDVFKDHSTLEFMCFLYSSYGFKRETDILKVGQDPNQAGTIEIIEGKDVIDRVVKQSTASHRKPNYEEINRKKTAVGAAGEDFVLEYEKKQHKKYRKQIVRVSLKDDTKGYDIISFDDNGNETHIEVKTCTQGDVNKVDFYLTSNEYEKLQSDPAYRIYYVCGLNRKDKKIIILTHANLAQVTFEPIAYKITAKVEKTE
jgi:hypothetical protein